MTTVRLARHAMATRFEMVLVGERPEALRAAGEEALEEIARWEDRLSLYRSHTDIAQVNARAARGPVRVAPGVFRLLIRARELSQATDGAFDPTAGPLVRAWGFQGGVGQRPDDANLAAARASVGWQHVELDPAEFTVRFIRPGMALDLGAIGKGFALDQALEVLCEAGVDCALVHGGTSTVCALGAPADAAGWTVALPGVPGADQPGESVVLRDETLSVSAGWGKSFRDGERDSGHVIDPRSGQPTRGALMAAVTCVSATDSDALSTALLVLGEAGRERIASLGCRRVWVTDAPGDAGPTATR
jgi:FAD:protein FMN transferase